MEVKWWWWWAIQVANDHGTEELWDLKRVTATHCAAPRATDRGCLRIGVERRGSEARIDGSEYQVLLIDRLWLGKA
jgi:hypothetical protein